jgi:hypothetical protein
MSFEETALNIRMFLLSFWKEKMVDKEIKERGTAEKLQRNQKQGLIYA